MSDAIAAVLSGDREPGGRLPFTIARSEADYPVLVIVPEDGHRIDYAEGVFIGYRHFDQLGIEPEFCFGHGIGYTAFELADLTLSAASIGNGSGVIAQVRVRNTGKRTGKTVVQLYVSPPDAGIVRPPRELKAFEALTLEPGEDRLLSMRLDPRAFAHWDELRHAWATVPGTYQVEAGRSSRDICLRSDLTIEPGDA
jgi:beta-glucosidase